MNGSESGYETSGGEVLEPIKRRKEKQELEAEEHHEDEDAEDDGDEEEEDDDDDDDMNQMHHVEGMYNPEEFKDLNVSAEIRNLFSYIDRYDTQNIEMETKFIPFIPEYIPSVGDTDPFIKILRPDNADDKIGLKLVDEPSSTQSEPAILQLQLRSVTKQNISKATTVKRVEGGGWGGERAGSWGKQVDKWIRDIWELHRTQPAPTVQYTSVMPDIDSLMQEWPADVETLLEELVLPDANLNIELERFVDTICSILDIPLYKSRLHSLHLLFSLYQAFQHAHLYNPNMQQDTYKPISRV